MIIGIDASRANRREKTGTEWYSYALIEALKKIPSVHHFVMYTRVPLEEALGECPQGWRVRVLRWPLRYLWTQIRFSWEMLRRPPDVLFIPAHAMPLIHPRRTVVTIHDIGFERMPELYRWYDRLYHRVVVRFAVHRAWKIIVPSEFTKREMVEVYGISPKRVTVVHHGYDARYGQMQNAECRMQNYFLYVGRLEKKKNVVGLIRAFAEYRKNAGTRRLVLVGKRGYGYENILAQSSKLKAQSHVDEYGWLPQEKMYALMQGATALILPSFYEGFGLPLLEAFATGTPVIASAIPALMEVGGDAAHYVSPDHPEMLALAMTKISTDSTFSAALVQRGHERIQQFSWPRAAEETHRLLTSA